MAVSSRLIRRRIRSVANTRKITKAMELVAAAKMRKSVQMALSSRAYAQSVRRLVDDVRQLIDPKTHPLLAGRRDAKHSMVVMVASDRGLCGSFNAQAIRKALAFLRSRPEDLRIVTVGKRAEAAARRAGYDITAAFESMANAPSYDRSRPIGDYVYHEFVNRHVDRVFVVSTDFKSAISQVPIVTQLLPIIPEDELPHGLEEETAEDHEAEEQREHDVEEGMGIVFEPAPSAVLNRLLPRLIDVRMYQALLESIASEQSSRMMAMRQATDNATEMLTDLTLTYNQARQASITREISEISAGKAAIE